MNSRHNSQEYMYVHSAEEAELFFSSQEGDVIKHGSKVTPLLPAVEDFLKLIGFQVSVPMFMKQLSYYSNQPLPVSRATLFNLPHYLSGKLPPSKTTLSKLIAFTFKALAEKAHTFKPRIPLIQTGGVAEGWDGLLTGIKQSNRANELFFLIEFIEKRMCVEHDILSLIANPSTSFPDKYQAYRDALKSNMRIPDDAYELLRAFFNKQEDQLSLDQKFLWVCSSKLDFYFSAIACLEIGWLQRITKEQPQMLHTRTSWFKKGIVSTFIKKLRIENQAIEIDTPFKLYLNWLATDIGTCATESCISHAKLASFIPLENEAETSEGYTKAEKQKDLLKDWKDSKYPSPKKFLSFIQNLRGGTTDESMFLADVGFAVIMLDKLFLELFNGLLVYSSVACYQTLEQSMLRYQDYFLHFQATLPGSIPAAA